jgi:hypothetical protein
VISVAKNRRNINYATVSVVKQSEENTSEELLRATIIIEGLHDIAVVGIRVMDVELMRDALYSRKPFITGSDRFGDCSPPFIGSGPIGEGDHVSPSPIGSALSDGENLASRGWVMTTYMFRVRIEKSGRGSHRSSRKITLIFQLVREIEVDEIHRLIVEVDRWLN